MNQTQTNTNLALKKLKGIKPRGIKVDTCSSTNKKLLDIGVEVIDIFSKDSQFHIADRDDNAYEYYYKSLTEFLDDKIKFNFKESDLEFFIYANCNQDYSSAEYGLMGMFSGWLLSTLTKRNKQKNKPTTFYINGRGMTFNHLFLRANEIDELIVDNFRGDYLCNRLGHIDGNVDLAAIINCSANKNLGEYFCSVRGKGNALIVANSYSKTICWGVSSHYGKTNKVFFINLKGDQIGDCSCFPDGTVDLCIEYNVQRENMGAGGIEATKPYKNNHSKKLFPQLGDYAQILSESDDKNQKINIIKQIYNLMR